MSMNGKRDDFDMEDFKACARNSSMKRGRAEDIVEQVRDAVLKWEDFAIEAGVPDGIASAIAKAQRTDILG